MAPPQPQTSIFAGRYDLARGVLGDVHRPHPPSPSWKVMDGITPFNVNNGKNSVESASGDL